MGKLILKDIVLINCMAKKRRKPGVNLSPKRKGLVSRRKFFGLFAGAAVFGGLGYCLARYNPPTFQEARADKSLREEYVNHIAEPLEELEYIKDIIYLGGRGVEGSGMSINFNPMDVGRRKSVSIYVYDNPFGHGSVKNENDFLSLLVDHEIEGHARNIYYGFGWFEMDDLLASPGEYSEQVFFDVYELIAYGNQLEKRHERGISKDTLKHTLGKYYDYYSDLINPVRDESIINRKMLGKFRERLFLEDFLDMFALLDGKRYKVILPGGVMNTKYGPVKLPENIIKRYGL